MIYKICTVVQEHMGDFFATTKIGCIFKAFVLLLCFSKCSPQNVCVRDSDLLSMSIGI